MPSDVLGVKKMMTYVTLNHLSISVFLKRTLSFNNFVIFS